VTKRLKLMILGLLATGVLAAGCGDEIDRANDAIDEKQEQVDRAKTVVEDPVGEAERKADKALEDAITTEDQP
jgi:hypothetical protein